MRKLIALILALSLIVSYSSANALSNSERWYQIEIIVFSHITVQGLQSEQWPWTPNKYSPSPKTVNLSTNENNSSLPYAALTRRYFILSSQERQLEKNNRYQVLLHLAWRQKIVKPSHALPVHIFGGNIYNASGSVIGKAEYGQQAYNPATICQVNGTITPSLIRYIDIKINLLFAQPLSTLPGASNYNNVQGPFAYFRLNQTRRMRSRELNYIGHPLYGVLVKVMPVD